MKKCILLIICLSLSYISLNFTYASENNTKTSKEIRMEIEKIRMEIEEIQKNNLENDTSYTNRTYNNTPLTTKASIEKDSKLLELKNKFVDLDYELAKQENRIINTTTNKNQSKSVSNLPFTPKNWDVYVYRYSDEDSGSLPLKWWHSNFHIINNILLDVPGLNRWNSRFFNFKSYITNTSANRIAILRFNLSEEETSKLFFYTYNNLRNKPYQEPLWMWANKNNTNAIYCSQASWLAYKKWVKNIDIDADGWFIVRPIDLILNTQKYWTIYYYDL